LRFEIGDATALPFANRFDIVTSARTLRWIASPETAINRMRQAARPTGMVVVLDYNHAGNEWEPKPPSEFLVFYAAFLSWRDIHDWDNDMADHLPAFFTPPDYATFRSTIRTKSPHEALRISSSEPRSGRK
jgi:ubiquinone/menaquinone biosynthesis C-methylase UbiE